MAVVKLIPPYTVEYHLFAIEGPAANGSDLMTWRDQVANAKTKLHWLGKLGNLLAI